MFRFSSRLADALPTLYDDRSLAHWKAHWYGHQVGVSVCRMPNIAGRRWPLYEACKRKTTSKDGTIAGQFECSAECTVDMHWWFETGRIREGFRFQLRRLQRPLLKQTEQRCTHRGLIADCIFLLDTGERNRHGDQLQQRLLKRGGNQPPAGGHYGKYAFPVGDPDAGRSKFSGRDTLN